MAGVDDLLALGRPALVERLCELNGQERSALARPARTALERYQFLDSTEGRPQTYPNGQGPLLELMVLASGPAEQLWWPHNDDQVRIARARGGRFVAALAREQLTYLTSVSAMPGHLFETVRQAERSGELRLEVDDTYVLAMIADLADPASVLRADRELLDGAFWRIFEVEGSANVSLATVDRRTGDGWRRAVVDLVRAGTIERARVIDATLAALGRGFSAHHAGWFSRLYGDLAPTPDEIEARQGEYANLLRSPVGPTVALAVGELSTLDDERIVVSCGSLAAAVLTPAKGTALRAMKLAVRRAERGGDEPARAAVAAALGHPHADVQDAALRQLRAWSDEQPVRAALDSLAPTVAAQARAWLGPTPTTTTTTARVDSASERPEPRPVPAIVDPAELAEAFAVLLANPTDAELLERALGAAARLGPDADRYASLARRATRLLRDGPVYEWGLLLDVVARLVLAAGQAPPPDFGMPPLPRSVRFLAARAAAVTTGLRAGRRWRPCAEPTHQDGWIVPEVLVERLATEQPDRLDLVAALLRLGPGPTSTVDGPPSPLGYALGGPAPATLAPDDHPLWIAAARARAPQADDPVLRAADPVLDRPGAGRAPSWRLVSDQDGLRLVAAVPVDRDPADPTADHLLPTVDLAHLETAPGRWPAGPWHPWIATIWPGNIGPVLAIALNQQLWSLDSNAGDTGVGRHALELVTRSAADLPPLAAMVLAAGLGAPGLADRTAAVDAAAALLPGRLGPPALAAGLAELANAVPLNRFARSLRELVLAGCAGPAREVATALLPRLDRRAHGVHALVEGLRDQHLEAGLPVTDGPLRAWLAGFSGGSRAARAAAGLLQQT